jgi:hypothetical protein
MRTFYLSLAFVLLSSVPLGCGGATMSEMRGDDLPEMPPLPPADEDQDADPAGDGAARTQTAAEPGPAAADQPDPQAASAAPEIPPLPPSLDGGTIPRPVVAAVLDAGIGRFLQQIRTEPHLQQGRFVGWRLLTVIPPEGGSLRPGDTIVRINGQSIERPEQFKNVWDSMATSSELVLDVMRGEQRGRVRFEIVDPEKSPKE